MVKIYLNLCFVLIGWTVQGQNLVRNKVTFPNVGGYLVLKADFHLHTVFSDGLVWPSERATEAYTEDLDAFSITDHLEIQRQSQDIPTDKNLNRSFELAKPVADNLNIMCIHGTEITREVPPGHTNAIFIQDANPLFNPSGNKNPRSAEGYEMAVKLAKGQGAFLFYNHPFHQLADDKVVMPGQVDQLIKEGQIEGIEVVNGDRFCKEGYNWAIERNLTLISNSDAHTSMPLAKLQHDLSHRAQTLILADDRNPESLLKALRAKRTLIWWRENFVGRKELLEPFVKACLPVVQQGFWGDNLVFEVENISPQKFTLEPISTDDYFMAHPLVLKPNSVTKVSVAVKNKEKLSIPFSFRVMNAWENYEKPIVINYIFKR